MGWLVMSEGTIQLNRLCEICHEPVTLGEPFYFRNKADVVYAHCAWEEEESQERRSHP